ncbi:hypothetical protein [Trinickia violacea]|uniref:hypothetical protein n=1 Tax=Trinickia violacea TaxID=2571746 RepID=UPI0020C7FF0D|nr:hypothetical protein [Trinickia violacea]
MAKKGPSRPRRTKEMLLPLQTSVVRDISLENHLALATMRSGHGTSDAMVALLRALYMTFYLLEGNHSETELALFLEVETTLDASIRAAAGEGRDWRLAEEQLPLIEHVLQRCDEVVGSVPKYCYVDALDKLSRFVHSAQQSPLPGSRLGEMWS